MTQMTKTSTKNKRPRRLLTSIPMKWRMIAYFSAFMLLTLAILWLFQTVLLGDMYQGMKTRELKRAAAAIALAAKTDEDTLPDTVYETAEKLNVCISVYPIKNKSAGSVITAHVQGTCSIHGTLTGDLLNKWYSAAEGKDSYIEKLRLVNLHVSEAERGEDADSILCAKVSEVGDTEYLILLTTNIAPISATVNTLTAQLGIITVILLIVAAVFALYLSGKFTRPFAKMGSQAKRLAGGNYDVKFEGGGWNELEELAGSLNYAASELSKLDTMQKELIANISHDLRTPLTMISGYSEVMRDIPGEMTPENIQIVIDETKRLSLLVNDLLDLSRLTSGNQQMHPEVIDMKALLEETMNRYTHLREHDGYSFTLDEDDGAALVYADKTAILQVLYNLINNAVNYTGDDKHVGIRLEVADKACRVSVSDSGDGISEDKLPLIWDRYYKISDYHRRGAVGSGLGLSIVKNILIRHNAQFGVTSTVGKGSTFWVELPTCGMTQIKEEKPKSGE